MTDEKIRYLKQHMGFSPKKDLIDARRIDLQYMTQKLGLSEEWIYTALGDASAADWNKYGFKLFYDPDFKDRINYRVNYINNATNAELNILNNLIVHEYDMNYDEFFLYFGPYVNDFLRPGFEKDTLLFQTTVEEVWMYHIVNKPTDSGTTLYILDTKQIYDNLSKQQVYRKWGKLLQAKADPNRFKDLPPYFETICDKLYHWSFLQDETAPIVRLTKPPKKKPFNMDD